jgi:hypothetical protein
MGRPTTALLKVGGSAGAGRVCASLTLSSDPSAPELSASPSPTPTLHKAWRTRRESPLSIPCTDRILWPGLPKHLQYRGLSLERSSLFLGIVSIEDVHSLDWAPSLVLWEGGIISPTLRMLTGACGHTCADDKLPSIFGQLYLRAVLPHVRRRLVRAHCCLSSGPTKCMTWPYLCTSNWIRNMRRWLADISVCRANAHTLRYSFRSDHQPATPSMA